VYPGRDVVLEAIPESKRQQALSSIQQRVASVMFVELLFDKGSREVDMVHEEYYWRRAIASRVQQAPQPPSDDDSDDDVRPGLAPFPHQY
jgi:hypothetical protein